MGSANPFAHFPRLIVSIDWLKGPLGMRLLREVLPSHPEIPRRYDILIVDEVHNCARAGGRYARDTLRTGAIRTLAPHCEHRLFLSATPHNGYDNSFAALLELLDPHRFARGIKPTKEATREITVRRLKQDLLDDDGRPRFARRKVVMLEVEHPDAERQVHADVVAYGASRAARLGGNPPSKTAADFIVTLLKKRLFSSPAAFLRTLEVHRDTLLRERRPAPPPAPTVLQRLFDDAANALDEEASDDGVGDAAREAIEAAASAEQSRPTAEELSLLDKMTNWARRAAVTEDARTRTLLDWVENNVVAHACVAPGIAISAPPEVFNAAGADEVIRAHLQLAADPRHADALDAAAANLIEREISGPRMRPPAAQWRWCSDKRKHRVECRTGQIGG